MYRCTSFSLSQMTHKNYRQKCFYKWGDRLKAEANSSKLKMSWQKRFSTIQDWKKEISLHNMVFLQKEQWTWQRKGRGYCMVSCTYFCWQSSNVLWEDSRSVCRTAKVNPTDRRFTRLVWRILIFCFLTSSSSTWRYRQTMQPVDHQQGKNIASCKWYVRSRFFEALQAKTWTLDAKTRSTAGKRKTPTA